MLVRRDGRGWGVATVPAPDSHSPAASGARAPPVSRLLPRMAAKVTHQLPLHAELLACAWWAE